MQIGDASVATVIDGGSAPIARYSQARRQGRVSRPHSRRLQDERRACRVELLNEPKKNIVSRKLVDEELGKTGNVYTRALNEGLGLKVVAQPTMKDGKTNRLSITRAEIAEKELV